MVFNATFNNSSVISLELVLYEYYVSTLSNTLNWIELNRGGQFYWWWKLEYPEKTNFKKMLSFLG